jgi:site-specific DNA-methyltransferase (adenine-specific)
MFPARLAHYFVQRYTRPGQLVVDPFSGRGTVPLQARVEGRRVVGNDLSPLAYVLTSAKADPPSWTDVMDAVDKLETGYAEPREEPDVSPDIKMLYDPSTVKQLCYIRKYLHAESLLAWSREKRMIAGALAGIMHGGTRRDGSSQYLSISMPNTFSMSPKYVENFIREKGLVPPPQDVFARIRDKLARLYLDAIDGPCGATFATDAASLLAAGEVQPGAADLIVTSPPYLQVVNYGQSNWIRLWLLGVDEVGREQGSGRKQLDGVLDHRHTYESYKEFMRKLLFGVQQSLAPTGVAAIVIGDVVAPGKDLVPLAEKIWNDLRGETGLHLMHLIEDHISAEKKVSRIWGDTKGQATDRDCVLVLSHQGAEVADHGDSVDWDEPYRDAGPDAAHARVRALRG